MDVDPAAAPVEEGAGGGEEDAASTKLQKVYRGYRTRRKLVDERWYVPQLLDFAVLKHSTASFSDETKPETAASRWSRAGLLAAKVGKGLSRGGRAARLPSTGSKL